MSGLGPPVPPGARVPRAASVAPWIHAQAGGLLLGVALATDGAGWLAWPALWLVAGRLDGRSVWERLGDGSLAGVWAAGLAVGPWLYDAIRVVGVAGRPEALALTGAAIVFGGVCMAAFTCAWPQLPAPRWLSGAAVWALLEVVRGEVVGMPWGLLGHTQDGWPALAQLAAFGGVPLVSFVVAAPGLALADRARPTGLVFAALLVLGAAGVGALELGRWAAPVERGVRLRGVSGGHLSTDRDVAYLASTTDGPRADVVVWPARAVPGVLQDEPTAVATVSAAARRHGPLVFGTVLRERGENGRRHFESAILLDASGSMRGRYDKRRLVPAVDRTPAGAPLAVGDGRGIPFGAGGLRLGPLLGWESLFPDLARWWADAGADVLVVMAEDEGPAAGVGALVRFSTFRAIEVRRWMLRASGTGRTLVVDPAGRRWRRDVITLAPNVPRPQTLHARAPWLPSVGWLGLLIVAVVLGGRRR